MPFQIVRRNITTMHTDAIVNTTNRNMVGYSGVDLALHTAAGKELDDECARLAEQIKTFPVVTEGFRLNCKYLIHTVGPVWQGGHNNEKQSLENCYRSCLEKARELGCESIAFPLISSGVYGFPKDKVLKIAVDVITDFLLQNDMTVTLCVFDRTSYEFSKKLFDDITDYITDSLDVPVMQKCLTNARFAPQMTAEECVPSQSLDDWVKNMDDSFAEKLFFYIDRNGFSDVECYKKANVDKKTFSKIKCNKDYRPSKQTVLAFCIALKLDLEETEALLKTVGMTLSHSNKADLVVEFFLANKKYNIYEINEALFEFELPLLGSNS